jgi:hypothetical protein
MTNRNGPHVDVASNETTVSSSSIECNITSCQHLNEEFGFEFEISFASISVRAANWLSQKEAIMRLLVLLCFLIVPVASYAQYVGDLSPNPFSSNSIGNPFDSGSPWSVIPPKRGARPA